MLKLALKTLVTIFVIFVLTIITVLSTIDVNDYKRDIENSAKNSVGLTIQIDGELKLSWWPLGVTVDSLSIIDQKGQVFTQVSQIDLSIDTLSLLKLAPEINGIYSNGANIRLYVDESGSRNWDLLTKSSKTVDDESQKTDSSVVTTGNTDQKPTSTELTAIPFLAKHIHIQNYRVDYINEQSAMNVSLHGFDLEVSDARLDEDFPIQFSFTYEDKLKGTRYFNSLRTKANISAERQMLSLIGLENNLDLSGILPNKKTIQLSLTGNFEYDIKADTLNASSMQVSGASIALDTHFVAKKLRTSPDITGMIHVAPFALANVNQYLGLNLPINDKAFNNIRVDAPFTFRSGTVQSSNFDLAFDESQFVGSIKARPATNFYDISLAGDQAVIDNYLAAIIPSQKQVTAPHIAAIESNNEAVKQILPLDFIQNADISFNLVQDNLKYQHIEASGIKTSILINNGRIRSTNEASVANGSITAAAAVNAQLPNPVWDLSIDANSLIVEKLMPPTLQTNDISLAGTLDLNGAISLTGNTIPDLKVTNSGSIQAALHQGRVDGVNIDAWLCKGISYINNGKYDIEKAGSSTSIKKLTSTLKLNNSVIQIKNTKLNSDSTNTTVDGTAGILNQSYEANFYIKPEANSSTHACRINPKLQNVSIPLTCQGSLIANQHDCDINYRALKQQVQNAAIDEAKRKTEKEVDRVINKHRERLDGIIGKDNEAVDKIKDSLLKLFN